MTTQGQFSRRMRLAQDRLAWGFGDLLRLLVELGLWPARGHNLVTQQGQGWTVLGTRLIARPKPTKPSGLLVKEPECLWGHAQLPDIPRQALEQAVEETLWRASPLPRDQMVAAWRAQPHAQGGWSVEWGVCRRSDCDAWRTNQGLAPDAPIYLERQGKALGVRGQDGQKRHQRQTWAQWGVLLLMCITLAAIATPGLMPVVLKREANRKAVRHIVEQEPKSIPIRKNLDDLRLNADLAAELQTSLQQDLPLASLVDLLAQTLPDDTWLDRLDVSGRDIRMSGLTGNATELMAQLARQPQLADARASVASVRDAGLNKERFTFEMRWRGEEAKP